MDLNNAQDKFIEAWGSLGSSWGISKSMAQIHALLLTAQEGLSTEEIMNRVQISRGNVNTNVRELINWKLVQKQTKLGDRKEYFSAEQEIYNMAQHIMNERRRRELEPVRALLGELQNASYEGSASEIKHFQTLITDLLEFVNQMDNLTRLMAKINNNNYLKKMIKSLS